MAFSLPSVTLIAWEAFSPHQKDLLTNPWKGSLKKYSVGSTHCLWFSCFNSSSIFFKATHTTSLETPLCLALMTATASPWAGNMDAFCTGQYHSLHYTCQMQYVMDLNELYAWHCPAMSDIFWHTLWCTLWAQVCICFKLLLHGRQKHIYVWTTNPNALLWHTLSLLFVGLLIW